MQGELASILLPCLVLSITVKKASRRDALSDLPTLSALMYARAAFPQIGSYATFSPYIATESTRALMAPLKGWSGVS